MISIKVNNNGALEQCRSLFKNLFRVMMFEYFKGIAYLSCDAEVKTWLQILCPGWLVQIYM